MQYHNARYVSWVLCTLGPRLLFLVWPFPTCLKLPHNVYPAGSPDNKMQATENDRGSLNDYIQALAAALGALPRLLTPFAHFAVAAHHHGN